MTFEQAFALALEQFTTAAGKLNAHVADRSKLDPDAPEFRALWKELGNAAREVTFLKRQWATARLRAEGKNPAANA